MPGNQQIEAAREYHNGTKHSYWSVRESTHSLDFSNYPMPFKIYKALEPLPLPRDLPPLAMPLLDAIADPGAGPAGERIPDLAALAALLHLSAGITRGPRGKDIEVQFRAAACTGALYHVELYLVGGDLPGLPAGVYHFGVHDAALRRLRAGDYRATLVDASGAEPAVAAAPAVVVCTSTYWRNAWKYEARAYRHCFWDTGTILANMLAAAAAQRLPARVVLGFVDAAVNRLLDLDSDREVALALVPLGCSAAPPPATAPAMEPLNLDVEPYSRFEIDYPAIRATHAASSLASAEEAAAWRGSAPPGDPPAPAGPTVALQAPSDAEAPADSVTEVILRRGSTRRFRHEAITFAQLSTLLDRATRGVPADFLEPPGATLNTLYLIVHAVDGLPPGTYVYHRARRALEALREGTFRREAGHLGLEQALPADAGVNIYFLADLAPVLARLGNRGYRAAQLEGGILGGKGYLAAYAQRFGATGLTFYDDDVTEFFSPHARDKSVMFLAAFGHPARRRSA
jgi:SagB-type dehydrogenase family enzyme